MKYIPLRWFFLNLQKNIGPWAYGLGPILAFEPHEKSIFSKLAWRFGAMVVNLPPSPQTPMIVMESWVLPTQLPTLCTHFCEMAMEIEASHWLATP